MAEETPPSSPSPHHADGSPRAEPASSEPAADERPAFTKHPGLASDAPLEPQTRHDRREAKRLAREAVRDSREEAKTQAEQKKSTFSYIVMGIVALAAVGLIVWGVTRYEPPVTGGFIHWHTKVQLELCGQKLDLPCLKQTSGTVHGEGFCGTPEFHHHYDNTIHMEGTFQKREDMAVGRFFDAAGIPFSETQVLNWTNGMTCPGGSQPGVVGFTVNGRPNPEWGGYATRDGDSIRITFG